MPPSNFGNDPIAVRKAIYDFKAHAAIIINSNATALLQQAVDHGNTTYDPKGAAQVIYVSARDQNTIPTYVVPQLTAFEMAVTSQFGASWTQSLMRNSTISRAILATVPQAMSPAIGFTTFDLRPFGPANVTPAVSIGLIYLIIIAFFSFTFFLPIHMKFLSPRGHPPLHFSHLIIWRWVATTGAYFFLSLGYSLASLAFQVPFSNSPASQTEPAINPSAYGKGTFVVYWMLNFLGMAAVGLACENVAMALGNPVSTPRSGFLFVEKAFRGKTSSDQIRRPVLPRKLGMILESVTLSSRSNTDCRQITVVGDVVGILGHQQRGDRIL